MSGRRGAGPNLVDEDFLNPQRKCLIKRVQSPKLRTTTREVIIIQVVTPLVVEMGDPQVRNWFGIVQRMAVNVLL